MKYKDSGVDIENENRLISSIQSLAQRTLRPGVLKGIGGFASLYEIPPHRYEEPVLVSCAQSIGTKGRLAASLKRYDAIGIDLVAMNVNDLLPSGAKPLYFLDYYTTGRLDLSTTEEIIQGISQGCVLSEVSLLGGEMSEMQGIYGDIDFDLAGFVVGIVDKTKMIDGSHIKEGDFLIALPSSGIHVHGFSLIQQMITENEVDLQQSFGVQTLGETLLKPTRIYVRTLLPLLQESLIVACAPINGGGITKSIPRILPKGLEAVFDLSNMELPPIFEWIQKLGHLTLFEMLDIFNCGVGMVLVVRKEKGEDVLTHLRSQGEQPWMAGYIQTSQEMNPIVRYEGN